MAKSSSRKRRDSPRSPEGDSSNRTLFLLRAVLIVAAVLWVYWPALRGGWIWDDRLLVMENPIVHDPGGLWKIWFDPGGSLVDFQPITVSVIWLQWQLWGNATLGYHLTNVVLHGVSALLVWRLLAKFGLRLAWIGGLIFAIHPVAVESVAWISELKNTLSLPPFLLAICFYLDYEKRGKRSDYFLSLGLFLVALLGKATMVMFPVVILLYAWWKRGRIGWGDLKSSAPFFAVSLVMGLVTVWFLQHHAMDKQGVPLGGFFSRLACAGLVISFYFSKCFLPIGLLPIYPRWMVDPPSPVQFLPWLVLGGVAWWLWVKRHAWGRHALLGLGFFLINLAPFLGFTAGSYMDFTWVMDHILYIPLIGLIGLTVAGLGQVEAQLFSFFRCCGIGLLTVALVLLAWKSHDYTKKFISDEALWTYTLKYNPGAWPARNNLGLALFNEGRYAEAMDQYEQVLRLNPDYANVHSNLGLVLAKNGRTSEAMDQYQQALRLDPDYAAAHDNMGLVLANSGRLPEALEQYEQALRLKPDFAEAHNNMGIALVNSGRFPEALEQFVTAVRIKPDYVEALSNRGHLKWITSDPDGAGVDLDQALALDSAFADAYVTRGLVREEKGDLEGALSDLRRYRELKPKDPVADYTRLWTWILRARQNQQAEAGQELAAALETNWNAAKEDWVSTDARFLLGQINETEFVALAASKDAEKDRGQHCEAWYYAGMKRLLAGDKAGAADCFRKSLATGKTDFLEYTLSQAELRILSPTR